MTLLHSNRLTGNDLDRAGLLRKDSAWVAERLADPTSRFLLSWRYRHLVSTDEPFLSVGLTPTQLGELGERTDSVTLLDVDRAGAARFAVDLCAADDGVEGRLAALGRLAGLREVAGLLPEPQAAELAYARAMAYWHRRTRYCGDCGRPTEPVEGGHVRRCTGPACDRLQFPRTDPAVIVAVLDGKDRCLLGRQARWRGGMYSTIAGFVDPGESLEEAVVREVREETGVRAGAVRYHSSQPWPFPRSLMVGFTARAEDATLRPGDDELADARWFTRDEVVRGVRAGTLHLPSDLSISYRLIASWFDRGEAGPLAALTRGTTPRA